MKINLTKNELKAINAHSTELTELGNEFGIPGSEFKIPNSYESSLLNAGSTEDDGYEIDVDSEAMVISINLVAKLIMKFKPAISLVKSLISLLKDIIKNAQDFDEKYVADINNLAEYGIVEVTVPNSEAVIKTVCAMVSRKKGTTKWVTTSDIHMIFKPDVNKKDICTFGLDNKDTRRCIKVLAGLTANKQDADVKIFSNITTARKELHGLR